MRVVFFDVDGVLIHGFHAKPELRKDWTATMQEDLGIAPDHFVKHFIAGVFINEVLVGRLDLASALDQYLPTTNSSITSTNFIQYWLSKDATINQALIEQVKRLKASGQVRLFIATNQEHNRAAYLMQDLGFGQYFDAIYHSARVGAKKPDSGYFTKVMQAIGAVDAPLIFFDDTPAVVDAANACGWEAHQFDDVADLHKSPLYQRAVKQAHLRRLRW